MRRQYTRRDFLNFVLYGSIGMMGTAAAGGMHKIAKLARTLSLNFPEVLPEWPLSTIIWKQDPAKGIKNYTSWQGGYDDDPFPNMMEFIVDPLGLFSQRGLWCHIPEDLALEDWDRFRDELLNQENIVLNDWIIMWRDSRDPANARNFIDQHKADMIGAPSDPDEYQSYLDFWTYLATQQQVRVYPSPMLEFDVPVPLPARVAMEFWLGDDFARKDGEPVVFDWESRLLQAFSVFDSGGPVILTIDFIGPLNDLHLVCRSSGDPRPGKEITSQDTFLDLTPEGQTRSIQPGRKTGILAEIWPGEDKRAFVYVRDAAYDPEYVLYAEGQYSDAAIPNVKSTHTSIYHSWTDARYKLVQGTFFLGDYSVWSYPEASTPTPEPSSTPRPSPSPSPVPETEYYYLPSILKTTK